MSRMTNQQANRWKITKKEWKAENPPDVFGYYDCWICGNPVIATQMTLDHYYSWAKYPELRFDHSNLRPAHKFCNEERGEDGDGMGVVARFGNSKSRRRRQ